MLLSGCFSAGTSARSARKSFVLTKISSTDDFHWAQQDFSSIYPWAKVTLNSLHSVCVFCAAHYVIKLIVLLVGICSKNTVGPSTFVSFVLQGANLTATQSIAIGGSYWTRLTKDGSWKKLTLRPGRCDFNKQLLRDHHCDAEGAE